VVRRPPSCHPKQAKGWIDRSGSDQKRSQLLLVAAALLGLAATSSCRPAISMHADAGWGQISELRSCICGPLRQASAGSIKHSALRAAAANVVVHNQFKTNSAVRPILQCPAKRVSIYLLLGRPASDEQAVLQNCIHVALFMCNLMINSNLMNSSIRSPLLSALEGPTV
jgi:hypothetical protein